MIRSASRRPAGRPPVASLPAPGPQGETRGNLPGEVCNIKLPKVSSFKLPLTPWFLQSETRLSIAPRYRSDSVGFRVARALTP